LIDINLGRGNEGIELAEAINQHHRVPFLFLTSYSDRLTLERAKTVNPLGYVVKPFTQQSLYAAIEIALHIHASQLKDQYPNLHFGKINNQLAMALTHREFEVIELIYDGRTNLQIAEMLLLSGNTVKKHINNAYLKMEVKTRTQALALLRKLMSQAG
jgi:DNA-binding NarL/FixJ family response regulator